MAEAYLVTINIHIVMPRNGKESNIDQFKPNVSESYLIKFESNQCYSLNVVLRYIIYKNYRLPGRHTVELQHYFYSFTFLMIICMSLDSFSNLLTLTFITFSTAADTKKKPYLRSYLNRRYNICPHVQNCPQGSLDTESG